MAKRGSLRSTGVLGGALVALCVAGAAPVIAAPTPIVQALSFRSATVGYAVIAPGPGARATLFETTDGGRRWTSLGVPLNVPAGGLAFDGQRGLALTNPNLGAGQAEFTVEATTDAGRTWRDAGSLFGEDGPLATAYADGRGLVLNGSFAGAYATLYGPPKAGATDWFALARFAVPSSTRKAAFSPSAASMTFEGRQGVVVIAYYPTAATRAAPLYGYRTTDAGRSWRPIAVGHTGLSGVVHALAFATAADGVAATTQPAARGNGVVILSTTEDGGRVWTRALALRNVALVGLDMVSARVGYAALWTLHAGGASAGSEILRTTNGGRTWTRVTTP